jgi:dipicolinate synthase subunit B
MDGKRIGYAMCGSFCTFEKSFGALQKLTEIYGDIMPIMSSMAFSADTRFGTALENREKLENLCGREIISTIPQAEPIGPKALLDLLIIAPCTGNTLAKLNSGVTDTAVTMAAKSHLRIGRPVLIAVSTNDGLSGSAANIGALLNRKNIYFVPFGQDDPVKKPRSLVADFTLLPQAAEAALRGNQLQPILI